MNQEIRYVRLPEVMKRTGLKRSTIYRKMLLGEFPGNHPISKRARGWLQSDIDLWCQSRLRPATK
jgi:prophage regulatory protein